MAGEPQDRCVRGKREFKSQYAGQVGIKGCGGKDGPFIREGVFGTSNVQKKKTVQEANPILNEGEMRMSERKRSHAIDATMTGEGGERTPPTPHVPRGKIQETHVFCDSLCGRDGGGLQAGGREGKVANGKGRRHLDPQNISGRESSECPGRPMVSRTGGGKRSKKGRDSGFRGARKSTAAEGRYSQNGGARPGEDRKGRGPMPARSKSVKGCIGV